ncbi:MAG: xanthan lyase, partial [Calditrichaeota bacterium]
MMIRSLFAGKRTLIFTLFALAWMWNGCTPQYRTRHIPYDYSRMDKETAAVHRQVEAFLYKIEHKQAPIRLHPATRIDSLRIDNSHKELTVWLNNAFASIPFREKNVNALYALLRETLARPYKDYRLHIYSMGFPIGQLIPNYYRHTLPPDTTRFPPRDTRPPIVRRENQPMPEKGLYGNTIALWPSHGWYYNREQKRWMWQRARLFGTVEDLMPAAFTTPYLLPMLEKAGANVFVPRERDVNSNKVIVDNDDPLSTGYSEGASSEHISWQTGPSPGFGQPDSLLYGHQNPFRLGSWRHTQSDTVATAWARWAPVFPDSGRYAVYVSYRADNNHVEDARYTVHHLGGHTVFKVNQTMGGHTWIYLGTFRFARGYHPGTGSVMLSNISREKGRVVSADAVRFGGGMGIVAREGQTSGRPAFTEGARYWMQSAGFPDTLVYNLHADTNDYKDDYQGRGEWVNYLFGAPNGPNRDRSKGLGVPVDLSLAFHTDAGITNSDTAVGTLLIYSTTGADTTTFFPDGTSRLASRDFADILQSQLVDDIRALYDPSWSRRGLRNARYSEAFRPNVPAALLELLSHQNWADARFMLDPRFRFDVSRAIYKAMLRYLANREQRPYVVAPLPVDHFSAVLDSAGRVRLNWQPVSDPLEPSARPVAYKVYRRRDNGDFDNGRIVTQPFMTMPAPDAGHIHSYKVTALNEGGESFDSEILSVGRAGTDRPVV